LIGVAGVKVSLQAAGGRAKGTCTGMDGRVNFRCLMSLLQDINIPTNGATTTSHLALPSQAQDDR